MKKIIHFSIVFFALFAVWSCHSSRNAGSTPPTDQVEESQGKGSDDPVVKMPADTDSLFASIERTPCFGRCPIYKIRIYHSGYTIFEAKKFTDTTGTFYGRISKEKMEAIRSYAHEINYFEMKDVYDDEYVTDLPAVITRCHFDGKDKTIRHRYEGPRELASFERLLDDQWKDVIWKKLPKEED